MLGDMVSVFARVEYRLTFPGRNFGNKRKDTNEQRSSDYDLRGVNDDSSALCTQRKLERPPKSLKITLELRSSVEVAHATAENAAGLPSTISISGHISVNEIPTEPRG